MSRLAYIAAIFVIIGMLVYHYAEDNDIIAVVKNIPVKYWNENKLVQREKRSPVTLEDYQKEEKNEKNKKPKNNLLDIAEIGDIIASDFNEKGKDMVDQSDGGTLLYENDGQECEIRYNIISKEPVKVASVVNDIPEILAQILIFMDANRNFGNGFTERLYAEYTCQSQMDENYTPIDIAKEQMETMSGTTLDEEWKNLGYPDYVPAPPSIPNEILSRRDEYDKEKKKENIKKNKKLKSGKKYGQKKKKDFDFHGIPFDPVRANNKWARLSFRNESRKEDHNYNIIINTEPMNLTEFEDIWNRMANIPHMAYNPKGYLVSSNVSDIPLDQSSTYNNSLYSENEVNTDLSKRQTKAPNIYANRIRSTSVSPVVPAILLPGDKLVSSNGAFWLYMQEDCDLVLYSVDGPVWRTNTATTVTSGCRVVFGVSRLTVSTREKSWNNGITIISPCSTFDLIVENNGDLRIIMERGPICGSSVVYPPEVIWSTNTGNVIQSLGTVIDPITLSHNQRPVNVNPYCLTCFGRMGRVSCNCIHGCVEPIYHPDTEFFDEYNYGRKVIAQGNMSCTNSVCNNLLMPGITSEITWSMYNTNPYKYNLTSTEIAKILGKSLLSVDGKTHSNVTSMMTSFYVPSNSVTHIGFIPESVRRNGWINYKIYTSSQCDSYMDNTWNWAPVYAVKTINDTAQGKYTICDSKEPNTSFCKEIEQSAIPSINISHKSILVFNNNSLPEVLIYSYAEGYNIAGYNLATIYNVNSLDECANWASIRGILLFVYQVNSKACELRKINIDYGKSISIKSTSGSMYVLADRAINGNDLLYIEKVEQDTCNIRCQQDDRCITTFYNALTKLCWLRTLVANPLTISGWMDSNDTFERPQVGTEPRRNMPSYYEIPVAFQQPTYKLLMSTGSCMMSVEKSSTFCIRPNGNFVISKITGKNVEDISVFKTQSCPCYLEMVNHGILRFIGRNHLGANDTLNISYNETKLKSLSSSFPLTYTLNITDNGGLTTYATYFNDAPLAMWSAVYDVTIFVDYPISPCVEFNVIFQRDSYSGITLKTANVSKEYNSDSHYLSGRIISTDQDVPSKITISRNNVEMTCRSMRVSFGTENIYYRCPDEIMSKKEHILNPIYINSDYMIGLMNQVYEANHITFSADASICRNMQDIYGIIPTVTFGNLTDVLTRMRYEELKCDCYLIMDTFGMTSKISTGNATSVQINRWSTLGCNNIILSYFEDIREIRDHSSIKNKTEYMQSLSSHHPFISDIDTIMNRILPVLDSNIKSIVSELREVNDTNSGYNIIEFDAIKLSAEIQKEMYDEISLSSCSPCVRSPSTLTKRAFGVERVFGNESTIESGSPIGVLATYLVPEAIIGYTYYPLRGSLQMRIDGEYVNVPDYGLEIVIDLNQIPTNDSNREAIASLYRRRTNEPIINRIIEIDGYANTLPGTFQEVDNIIMIHFHLGHDDDGDAIPSVYSFMHVMHAIAQMNGGSSSSSSPYNMFVRESNGRGHVLGSCGKSGYRNNKRVVGDCFSEYDLINSVNSRWGRQSNRFNLNNHRAAAIILGMIEDRMLSLARNDFVNTGGMNRRRISYKSKFFLGSPPSVFPPRDPPAPPM